MSHVINEWHAYKIDGSNAELTIIGEGFGSSPGAVKIHVKGDGKSYPQILSWSDTVIVTSCPVDAEIKKAEVELLVPDKKGKLKKHKEKTPKDKPKERESTGAAPEFNITDVQPTPDHLTLTGTNLDLIDQIVLYDVDAPPLTVSGEFVEDMGDLIVDWPDSFSGELEKLRAINEPDQVQEVVAALGGWSPAEPGLIQWSGGSRTPSGDIQVSITGAGFGAAQGDVFLTSASGEVQVLVLSWDDSAIIVSAAPKTVYTSIKVVDGFGVEAEVSPTAPATTVTPGLLATIANVTQSAENPEQFTISGVNLDQVASGSLSLNASTIDFYSDDPAFHDASAAAMNTAGGTSAVSFSSGQIILDAANDESGKIAQNLTLRDLNGATNAALNFPDFIVDGLPGSPTGLVNNLDTGADGIGAALIVRGINFSTLKHVTAVDKNSDAQILTPSIVTASGNLARVPVPYGERYTDVEAVLMDDSIVTKTAPETYSQIPYAHSTSGFGASSTVSNRLDVTADGLAGATNVRVFFKNAGGTQQGTSSYVEGNLRWEEWQSKASEAAFIADISAIYSIDSIVVVPGSPDTVQITYDGVWENYAGLGVDENFSDLEVWYVQAFFSNNTFNSVIFNAITITFHVFLQSFTLLPEAGCVAVSNCLLGAILEC